MLFCKSFKATTTVQDVIQYFNGSGIPITNLISTASDGAPALMKRHNGVLKLLKNDNPRMMAVRCIIYRDNLVTASISGELDQMLKNVINVVIGLNLDL